MSHEIKSFVQSHSGKIGLGFHVKDLLPVGLWKHPSGSFEVPVDRDYLDELVKNTNRAIAAKVKVPLPLNHSYSAADNTGQLEEVWVGPNEWGNDSLYGLVEVTEPDIDGKIERNTITSISVSLTDDLIDGTGEHYGPCVEHVALTDYPVVSEQSPFVSAPDDFQVAMSKGKEATVKCLSLHDAPEQSSHEEVSSRPFSHLALSKIPASAYLIVGDEADPETWKLPVFEGYGPLENGRLSLRGSLNRNALRHASAALCSGQFSEDTVKLVARRLLGLHNGIGEKAPASLLAAAGLGDFEREKNTLYTFEMPYIPSDTAEVKVVEVNSLKDIVADREMGEREWIAVGALRDFLAAIIHSEMTADEKKGDLETGLAEFADLVSPLLSTQIAEDLLGVQMEDTMKEFLESEQFKTLIGLSGVSIPDAGVSEDFATEVFAAIGTKVEEGGKALGKVEELTAKLEAKTSEPPKDPPADPVKPFSEQYPEQAKELDRLRAERKEKILSGAKEQAKLAMESGKLTKDGAEAFEKLLCTNEGTNRIHLSTDGVVGEEGSNVIELASLMVDGLPDGAALDLKERTKRQHGTNLSIVPSGDPEPDPKEVAKKSFAASGLKSTKKLS